MIFRRIGRLLACRLALYSGSGLTFLQCSTPVTTLAFEGEPRRDILVVFLPGIGDFAEDFDSRGFIGALLDSGLDTDAMAVDAHYGYYARRSLHERLAQDVVLPARSRGYREIWLIGISMGGAGALSYVAHHPDHVSRALLLAPYLGESEDDSRAEVQHFWRWIREQHRCQAVRPRLYLGYGARDRFAEANARFGEHLPQGHVLTVPGGHDWRTWKRLWHAFLGMWTEKP